MNWICISDTYWKKKMTTSNKKEEQKQWREKPSSEIESITTRAQMTQINKLKKRVWWKIKKQEASRRWEIFKLIFLSNHLTFLCLFVYLFLLSFFPLGPSYFWNWLMFVNIDYFAFFYGFDLPLINKKEKFHK